MQPAGSSGASSSSSNSYDPTRALEEFHERVNIAFEPLRTDQWALFEDAEDLLADKLVAEALAGL
jgi:hypothetical protein